MATYPTQGHIYRTALGTIGRRYIKYRICSQPHIQGQPPLPLQPDYLDLQIGQL
jgi:hypothetical protein